MKNICRIHTYTTQIHTKVSRLYLRNLNYQKFNLIFQLNVYIDIIFYMLLCSLHSNRYRECIVLMKLNI